MLLLVFAPRTEAAVTITVGTPSITNYANPYYVIDSDAARNNAAYTRHEIPVQVAVTLVKTGTNFESRTVRVFFRLLNKATGQAVPLVGETGTPPSIPAGAKGISTSTPNTYNLSFDAKLRPAAQLHNTENYEVEAYVEVTEGVAGYAPFDTKVSNSNYLFYHFRGPFGPDANANLISRVTGVSAARRWLVDTAPGQEHFLANVTVQLHRYDEPTTPATNDPMLVTLHVELVSSDQTSVNVPLATASFVLDPSPLVPSYLPAGIGVLQRPALVTTTVPVLFRPAPGVQVDSVAFTYRTRVRVSHIEIFNPFTPLIKNGNQTVSAAQRYLHFNGRLDFGNVPTTIRVVTNTPTSGVSVASPNLHTSLGLGPQGATLDQHPGFTAGPGTIDIGLRPNGDAFCRAPSSINVNLPPEAGRPVIAGVPFYYGGISLDSSGAKTGFLEAVLPAGFGWTENKNHRTLQGTVRFQGAHALTPQLLPASPDYAIYSEEMLGDPPLWVAEETKPVLIRLRRLVWVVAEGRFALTAYDEGSIEYVRKRQVDQLAATTQVPSTQRYKRSNDDYWQLIAAVSEEFSVRAGFNGGAELTADFAFGSVTGGIVARPHFPLDSVYFPIGGRMRVVDDLVVSDPAFSHLDHNPTFNLVGVGVSADCIDPSCGTSAMPVGTLLPTDHRLRFTTDGGVVASGPMQTPFPLRWGRIPALARFAHATDPFTQGSVHLPGTFLRGNLSFRPLEQRPAIVHLSGANPHSGQVTERPGSPAYFMGLADYAGLNFRAGSGAPAAASGMKGESTLGGGAYGPYDLKNRSKYYVRRSGISGIHDKVGTSPEQVTISGYQFTFFNFGLAFLSNVNVDSRTEGNLFLPYPTNDSLDFEKLLFLCNGALDRADIKNGPQTIVAEYWNAEIDVAYLQFKRNPSQLCDPSQASLAMGVTTYMAHVRDSLQGELGVFPHGNFIPPGAGVEGLDSRLMLPSQVRIRGPRRAAPGASGFETYTVTPTIGAFFNVLGNAPGYAHPASIGGSLAQGFVNLPGLVRVSFFEAIEAHIQTASRRPPEDLDNPGPWGAAELFVANGRWGNPAKSYFTHTTTHDKDNRGFPGASSTALNTYRTSPAHFVRARQKWLGGALALDYPVQWNFGTRSFRSAQPVKDDFVVMTLEQRVAYLSAERAEVRFGAQIGLPQINLANFVINTLDDATGMASAVSSALGNTVTAHLHHGLDRLAELLADQKQAHYERIFGAALDSFVNQLYNHLLTQWTGTGWVGGEVPLMNAYFANAQQSQLWQQVWLQLSTGSVSQRAAIGQGLDAALQAIDTFTGPNGFLRPGAGGSVDPALVRTLVTTLIQQLAGQIDSNLAAVIGNLAGAQLDSLIAPHLTSAGPTLADLRVAFLDLRAALQQVRDTIDSGDFATELNQLLVAAFTSELPIENTRIRNLIRNYLGTFNSSNRFNLANPAVVKQKLRRSVTDRFYATAYVANVQVAVKQRIFDLNGTVRSVVDSSFGQVNEVIRGALAAAALELDNNFTNVLGAFGGAMASAAIDGYAVFNGDALRQVRLDGKFRWNVPTATHFTAYLEINQYQSGADTRPCGDNGKDAAEVILGANNVPCDFLSPNMRVDIATKFSFDIEPSGKLKPVGFAGSFQKTAGEVSFEAFSITDLAVAVAFGRDENYLSAALGLRFNSYKAKGGIFFGKTCTLQPIMMWDMFVASALGQPSPTFTGAYVYGEAHIPVSEAVLGIPASCFFRVNAGMGLGVFYFIEGPTYGARGMLSVSGDALCMLSLGGQLDFVGLKQGSKFKLKATGRVYVEIGICFACVEASRSVSMTTEVGGGKAKGGKPSVK